jgi:tetratricopeptide (TPR) repeat protein
MDGNKAFSIATKEKTSVPKKIFAEPPSRNDAFIWQIRNFLAQDLIAEAASLIVVLRNDPNFPKRLQNDLEEVQAYWFYKQKMWDSAAPHLANAVSNATNKQEKARWEYLTAQLYELSGNSAEAEKYYTKSISHTTDPIMDIYARLYSIRMNKSGGENYIERNINDLLKMAKRDKYENYRDIIYYMAAQMQLERDNIDGALALLQKSTLYYSGDYVQRNKAFLQMAEMTFAKKQYRQAYNYYDSLNLADSSLPDVESLNKRKEMLGKIASNIEVIERQDSLQRVAAMPEDERKIFIKKLVRELRRQQGLKDDGSNTLSPFQQPNLPPLFSNTQQGGDWYFYNANYRIRGATDFKARWGNRPNVDNWRRSSAISAISNKIAVSQQTNQPNIKKGINNAPVEITYDALIENLPLTKEMIGVSNDSISTAMFNLGKLYAQDLEDCGAAIETFENFRNRFQQFDKMDEVLFNLYYCYNKTRETAKAAQLKKILGEKYPQSNLTIIVNTGKNPLSKSANPDATKTYEKVYDLFIEGNFSAAIAQKKLADSLFGKNYWTPQLLYIEAVYYIKQREDSVAKNVLNSIINQFAGSPLAAKATTLLSVLSRRKQIEEELQNLVIAKPKQENITINPVTAITTKPVITDTLAGKSQQPVATTNKQPVDTSSNKPVQQNFISPYNFTPDAQHYVMIILTKVDPIFSGEAKNAFFRYNRETYYNKLMTAELIDLDTDNRLLLISPFKNAQEAVDYIDKAKPLSPTEIIPWLKGGKYIFSVITDKNLDLLKANKDLENYKKFLSQKLPGKF